MIRIQTAWGRLYKLRNGLLLPSVTTFLRATEKDPFNTKRWLKKLTTKGLSEHEAGIYTERFVAMGLTMSEALRYVSTFIDSPMPHGEAQDYMKWKTPHSAARGTKVHDFIEHGYPIGEILDHSKPPVAKNETTQKLVDSLYAGNILPNVRRILSTEQRLWYWNGEEGFAGTEDVFYETLQGTRASGDWKSKDPKPYSQEGYSHEYKMQLLGYAAARLPRLHMPAEELHINYCFSDGSPGEQVVVCRDEMRELWREFKIRLKAWWATVGPELEALRNA